MSDGSHAIVAKVMELLEANESPGFGEQALDAVADLVEDSYDEDELPEVLQELTALAAYLQKQGMSKAAEGLATVVGGFAEALEELLDDMARVE